MNQPLSSSPNRTEKGLGLEGEWGKGVRQEKNKKVEVKAWEKKSERGDLRGHQKPYLPPQFSLWSHSLLHEKVTAKN